MEKAVLHAKESVMPHKSFTQFIEAKNDSKIIVVIGKTASGKSSLAKDTAEVLGIDHKITYTTRPPREGEQNGVDYHFITKDEFKNGDFLCKEEYEVEPYGFCGYGVKQSDLETVKNIIIVLTPKGFYELKEKYGDRVIGVYIMARTSDRWHRYISRDPNDPEVIKEATRRFSSVSDNEYFEDLEFDVDLLVFNNKPYNQVLQRMFIDVEFISQQ